MLAQVVAVVAGIDDHPVWGELEFLEGIEQLADILVNPSDMAEVVEVLREINALHDTDLPLIDALYIGGGFPETQAAELAGNISFAASVKAAVEKGLPVYAECGGLIYLGRSLKLGDTTYPMTSVLPADFVLEKKPQAHGYTELEISGPNPFFEMKHILRGHEFHYSRIVNLEELRGMVFYYAPRTRYRRYA